jgi:NAD(P)H dehydrogenase (quinone)
MMLPLIHHGAMIIGVPYTVAAVANTVSGGSPYGASHYAGAQGRAITNEEKIICRELGKRVALVAMRMRG